MVRSLSSAQCRTCLESAADYVQPRRATSTLCILICVIGVLLSTVGSLVGAFLPFLFSLPLFAALLIGFWNSTSEHLNRRLCVLTVLFAALTVASIPILNAL